MKATTLEIIYTKKASLDEESDCMLGFQKTKPLPVMSQRPPPILLRNYSGSQRLAQSSETSLVLLSIKHVEGPAKGCQTLESEG